MSMTLSHGFLVIILKSSLWMFCRHHHDLVNRYRMLMFVVVISSSMTYRILFKTSSTASATTEAGTTARPKNMSSPYFLWGSYCSIWRLFLSSWSLFVSLFANGHCNVHHCLISFRIFKIFSMNILFHQNYISLSSIAIFSILICIYL
jgi:hypothetical protein